MHPFLRPSIAGPIAILCVASWGAFAFLVVAIGPAARVLPRATAVPAIDQNVPDISLAAADAVQVSTAKSDRLPWPPPVEPEPVIKPAEAFDYAQAQDEAEKKVRRAHAEAPDLCQRHGMKKVWTKDGKSWRCRR
jgi:hypothetical protein